MAKKTTLLVGPDCLTMRTLGTKMTQLLTANGGGRWFSRDQ